MRIKYQFGNREDPSRFQCAMDFLQCSFLIWDFAQDSHQDGTVILILWQFTFSKTRLQKEHIFQTGCLLLLADTR